MQDLPRKDNSDGHCPLDNNCHRALQVSPSTLTKSGFEFSSGKKRKGVEILLLSDGDNKDKVGRINRSPEVHKIGNSDLQLVSDQTSYVSSEREKLGDWTRNDWADVWLLFYVKN